MKHYFENISVFVDDLLKSLLASTDNKGIDLRQIQNVQPSVDKKFRPTVPLLKYPPFKNGRTFEEYFFDFWRTSNVSTGDRQYLHYIDVFWLNLHIHKPNSLWNRRQLEEITKIECDNAKKNGQIPFTLCQWDDNISITVPDNLVVFAIGAKQNVPVPLIIEDKTNRLLNLPRLTYQEKKYLCSFVGTTTHNIRRKVWDHYKNNKQFKFAVKTSWQPKLPEDLVKTFIDITQYSKFALAPRGYGVSSFRFFEIMQMGVIPIYIHNDDKDNGLPFLDEPELIDYSKFAIVLNANEIPKLAQILESITEEKYTEMQKEVERMNHYFSLEESCKYILRNLRRRYEKSQ